MGAYENPVPIVNKSEGQNLAALQGMIAKNFAMGMQGYQARQKEIRIKKEKEDAIVDKALKQGDYEVSLMQRAVLKTEAGKDFKFKQVDWSKFYEGDIAEYERLSDAIALGTSESPSADRKRMSEIYGSVTNLTESLGYISATASTINESLNGATANKPGGVYTGEQASTIQAFRIFSGQMEGSTQPRRDESGELLWDVIDGEGKLVETVDPSLLKRLSELNQSVVTTISNPNANFQQNINDNTSGIFQADGKDNAGNITTSKKDNSAGINPDLLIPSGTKLVRSSDGKSYTYVQMYSTDYDKIMKNPDFAVMASSTVEGELKKDMNHKGFYGYANTQMQNIKLTKENFINNPQFRNPDGSAKYTEKNLVEGDPVGGEAFAMINDTDKSGDYMFDMEGELTDDKKDIINMMYQKHWLRENVPAENIASSSPVTIDTNKQKSDNFKNILEITYANDDKYRIEKGSREIDAGMVLTDMLNNDAINNSALTDFLVVTKDVIDQQKSNFEANYGKSLVQSGDAGINPDGSTKYDKGADEGPQRAEMEKQRADLVKDLQKAFDEKNVYDKRTGAVLTYDMMNAKIQTKQKEALNTRTNPVVTPEEPSTNEETIVEEAVITPPPPSNNDKYGDKPFNEFSDQERYIIENKDEKIRKDYLAFRKKAFALPGGSKAYYDKLDGKDDFEAWFDSGRPSDPNYDKENDFDVSDNSN